MKYFTCYEDKYNNYFDEYENEKTALEYAKELKSEGYIMIKVLSEKQMISNGFLEE